MRIKGILSFPTLFVAKKAKGSDVPKYSTTILLPAGDPQIPMIQAEVNAAIAVGYPAGMPVGTDCCFQPYDQKFAGKDYYDPRFSGWMALSCSAREDDRPSVVTGSPAAGFTDIIDPSAVFSGCVAEVALGISHYNKGKTGIGGWLNGVLFNGEEGSMGRLDGRPTVDQMFGGAAPTPGAPGAAVAPVHQMLPAAGGATYEAMVAGGWNDATLVANGMMAAPVAAPPAVPAAPAPPIVAPNAVPAPPAVPAAPAPPAVPAAPAPPAVAAAPAPPVHQMTAAAGGATYEAMVAGGWTDETLIANGMMLAPGGVAPVFA